MIDANEEGILEEKESALLQLKRLDKPLVVVGIAGLYRTGKSYLMNRLAGKANGSIYSFYFLGLCCLFLDHGNDPKIIL